MTDKQVIVDGVDVSECNFCEWKSSDIPQCRIRLASFEPTCKGYNCYYKQLKRKEQECEELKHEVELMMDCASCKVDEYKQTLAEIKEIAECMHDLWINKTTYTDMDNLVKHLLECELNRIRYKLDEISECEVENEN